MSTSIVVKYPTLISAEVQTYNDRFQDADSVGPIWLDAVERCERANGRNETDGDDGEGLVELVPYETRLTKNVARDADTVENWDDRLVGDGLKYS